MIIIDSGLGGISVVRALRATHPGMPLVYCADTGGFPYGNRTPEDIRTRAASLIRALQTRYPSMPIVLACNTLSTLSLDYLRRIFDVPLVGTVPAIKTAAQRSQTRRFTILATPNTASSQYTQDLIGEFASDCVVDAYGAPNLAAMAESVLLGNHVDLDTIRQELRPAFCDDAYGKTDCMVLGCTHYPLILSTLIEAAPWHITWIDSSEAIARRALSFTDVTPATSIAYVTSTEHVEQYRTVFTREGFAETELLTLS